MIKVDETNTRVYAGMPELWLICNGGLRACVHAERDRESESVPAM